MNPWKNNKNDIEAIKKKDEIPKINPELVNEIFEERKYYYLSLLIPKKRSTKNKESFNKFCGLYRSFINELYHILQKETPEISLNFESFLRFVYDFS